MQNRRTVLQFGGAAMLSPASAFARDAFAEGHSGHSPATQRPFSFSGDPIKNSPARQAEWIENLIEGRNTLKGLLDATEGRLQELGQPLGDPRLRALMSIRSVFVGALQNEEALFNARQQIDVPRLREGLRHARRLCRVHARREAFGFSSTSLSITRRISIILVSQRAVGSKLPIPRLVRLV
jgi:hypothetical protein